MKTYEVWSKAAKKTQVDFKMGQVEAETPKEAIEQVMKQSNYNVIYMAHVKKGQPYTIYTLLVARDGVPVTKKFQNYYVVQCW